MPFWKDEANSNTGRLRKLPKLSNSAVSHQLTDVGRGGIAHAVGVVNPGRIC